MSSDRTRGRPLLRSYRSSAEAVHNAESKDLFAYVEVESDERWQRTASTDPCRRCWAHMRDLVPSNRDDGPVSRDLREVFHLECAGRGAPAREAPAPSGH